MSINTAMTAIADAIREKTGSTGALSLADMPGAIESIDGNDAFVRAFVERTITSINIPNGTTIIGYNCFAGCTKLVSVVIPDTVLSLDSNAFRNCTGMTEIELPASVTAINTQAFAGCSNLIQITVHKAQDSISGAPWGATNATVIWTEEQ